MRLQMCLALGLLAGAAMAQDGYWNRRDQQWQRHEDRQIDRDLARLDRAHDWVLDHGRYRYWERDHWVYEPGFVDLAVPGFAVYEGRSVFDLNVEIGNLNVELTTLRHGPVVSRSRYSDRRA